MTLAFLQYNVHFQETQQGQLQVSLFIFMKLHKSICKNKIIHFSGDGVDGIAHTVTTEVVAGITSFYHLTVRLEGLYVRTE